MDKTHPAYWELSPTLDHVIPIARGGKDVEENIVSTSMLRNNQKANWTLEEMGWTLYPEGDLKQWDGMLNWFLQYIERHKELLNHSNVVKWYKIASISLNK